MSIEFHQVSKIYPRTGTILDQADLRLEKNTFTALIGKSGEGKSTVLNLISGLDQPTSGQILVNDQPITKMTDKQLSQLRSTEIGFVFQFFYLQPFLTVIENVETASYPNKTLDPKIRRAKAQQLLEAVGLAEKQNAKPSTLSGGETQRVAIARALMNSPSIILADEPTGNLDTENSRLIIELLRKIQLETHCTLLIVTHDRDVTNYADQVLTIKQGKLTHAPI